MNFEPSDPCKVAHACFSGLGKSGFAGLAAKFPPVVPVDPDEILGFIDFVPKRFRLAAPGGAALDSPPP